MNGRIITSDSEKILVEEILKIGPEAAGVGIMSPKGQFRIIRLDGLKCAAANILKQEMLSRGGEVVISNMVYRLEGNVTTNALIMGTIAQFQALICKLRLQPLKSLIEAADILTRLLEVPFAPMKIGSKEFNWESRTYIMGIINVTPDSFSGDGLAGNVEKAVEQGKRFAAQGADILDIGGESTRPGSEAVSADEELRRVIPVVKRLCRETSLPISIDTSKSEVAKAALSEGAAVINDVWGLNRDSGLKEVISRANATVVIMHNRNASEKVAYESKTGGFYQGADYEDLIGEICHSLRDSIKLAVDAGIPFEKIVIDPGIGFGKTPEQNLTILRRLAEFKSLGCPILLGTSRKSFIGRVLDRQPGERLFGTAASIALGIAAGANIVRVHDVDEMVQVARLTDAVLRA
ncbi:MAG: dihydropteroate synthase [Candidatus Riflebacteria bacterium]|nr:dihydropteroate synthase [Candidatus Riflebacteria bacterium]